MLPRSVREAIPFDVLLLISNGSTEGDWRLLRERTGFHSPFAHFSRKELSEYLWELHTELWYDDDDEDNWQYDPDAETRPDGTFIGPPSMPPGAFAESFITDFLDETFDIRSPGVSQSGSESFAWISREALEEKLSEIVYDQSQDLNAPDPDDDDDETNPEEPDSRELQWQNIQRWLDEKYRGRHVPLETLPDGAIP
jgi:hypothetical protein